MMGESQLPALRGPLIIGFRNNESNLAEAFLFSIRRLLDSLPEMSPSHAVSAFFCHVSFTGKEAKLNNHEREGYAILP
jgi:hypothetical protein